MIKAERKSPKPKEQLDLEKLVLEQQATIENQDREISNLKAVMDDVILNSMGGGL